MPTVADLTALYGNFMIGPRSGPDVCRRCFNLTDGFDRCYACLKAPGWLDAMAPISYSVAHEQLHHVLASYKRSSGKVARRHCVELAAVLWRHLAQHERCVARAAGTPRFDVITTIPSSDRERDETHPLHHIVAELVQPARPRHARLLMRSPHDHPLPHVFSAQKYEPTSDLSGQAVLLIDDTWTTGANAQSAAAALKAAGARCVAAIVIGRHVNREWGHNDRRLRDLAAPFDWNRCALCAPKTGGPHDLSHAGLASGGAG
jgi:predicted amidophosphoribosyltransferase